MNWIKKKKNQQKTVNGTTFNMNWYWEGSIWALLWPKGICFHLYLTITTVNNNNKFKILISFSFWSVFLLFFCLCYWFFSIGWQSKFFDIEIDQFLTIILLIAIEYNNCTISGVFFFQPKHQQLHDVRCDSNLVFWV